jgi:hypothetical protein
MTPIALIALRARAFALASIVSPVVVLFLLAPRVAAAVVRSSASVVRLARVVRARAFARVRVRRRSRLARSRPRRRPRVFVASAVVVVVVVARPRRPRRRARASIALRPARRVASKCARRG